MAHELIWVNGSTCQVMNHCIRKHAAWKEYVTENAINVNPRFTAKQKKYRNMKRWTELTNKRETTVHQKHFVMSPKHTAINPSMWCCEINAQYTPTGLRHFFTHLQSFCVCIFIKLKRFKTSDDLWAKHPSRHPKQQYKRRLLSDDTFCLINNPMQKLFLKHETLIKKMCENMWKSICPSL